MEHLINFCMKRHIVNHIWSFSLPHDIWPWVALTDHIKVIGCSFNFIGLCIIEHVLLGSEALRSRCLLLDDVTYFLALWSICWRYDKLLSVTTHFVTWFLTSWHTLWYTLTLLHSFWRHVVIGGVMTYFPYLLRSWLTLWCPDALSVFFTSLNIFWCFDILFNVQMYFPYFFCYDVLFDVIIKYFFNMMTYFTYFLTSWHTYRRHAVFSILINIKIYILASWRILYILSILVDAMRYFYIMTYCVTSWHTYHTFWRYYVLFLRHDMLFISWCTFWCYDIFAYSIIYLLWVMKYLLTY